MKRRNLLSSAVFEAMETRRLMAADLVVESVVATPTAVAPGNSFEFQVTLKNQGDAATGGPVSMKRVFSSDAKYGNADDRSMGLYTYQNSIAAGESVTITMKQYTSIVMPGGDYYLGVEVNPYGSVVENTRTNNLRFSDTRVLSVATKLDDYSLLGTSKNDTLLISQKEGNLIIKMNGKIFSHSTGGYADKFFIDGGLGKDKILADASVNVKLQITGGGGPDTIVGGSANDEVSGGSGNDRVFGGAGHDYCLGGAGSDRVYGEVGNDICSGGGGNDFLYGGEGFDSCYGGAGNDNFFAKDTDGRRDVLSGHAGQDTAECDSNDIVNGIEEKK